MVGREVGRAFFSDFCLVDHKVWSCMAYRAKGTVAEWSDSADNYRGEILGGIMVQLVLRAASRVLGHDYLSTAVDCDNQGVVIHGNSPRRCLKEKQPQADVLRVFKRLVMEQHFHVEYCWVQSHTDRAKKWEQCSLKESVNQKVDRLCKAALIEGVRSGKFIDSAFPSEQVRVYAGETKVTGSLRKAFECHWGRHTDHDLYHELGLIDRGDFNLVWWDEMEERVMHYYTKIFCVFVTKKVSGCAGTNQKLARWNDDMIDTCPNCGLPGESTKKHMASCRDEGPLQFFCLSVKDVLEYFHDAGVENEMIDLFEEYLLAQGSRTMEDCLQYTDSDYLLLAQVQDRLGLDCLVEDRISTLMLETVKPFLARRDSRRSLAK